MQQICVYIYVYGILYIWKNQETRLQKWNILGKYAWNESFYRIWIYPEHEILYVILCFFGTSVTHSSCHATRECWVVLTVYRWSSHVQQHDKIKLPVSMDRVKHFFDINLCIDSHCTARYYPMDCYWYPFHV